MPRITATEFQKNVGKYSDIALREPVHITSHGRDRLVVMSAEAYESQRPEQDLDALMRDEVTRHKTTLIKLADR